MRSRMWQMFVVLLLLLFVQTGDSLEFVTVPRNFMKIKNIGFPIVRLLPYNDYRMLYNLRYQPTSLPPIEKYLRSNQSTTASPTTPTMIAIINNSTSSTVSPPINSTTTSRTTIMRPTKSSLNLNNFLQLAGSVTQANFIAKPKGKGFLSIFEVIKFQNSKCSISITDIRSLDGVCYHEFECKSLGGSSMGECAAGVGVCCIFIKTCGMSTSQPISYFESPNYPKPVQQSVVCVFTLELHPNTQQVRIDFLMFELNRPTNGDCIDDQFIISGQNINFQVPTLCGINTGQHLYIAVDNALERRLFLSIFAKGSRPRSFNMRVMQLENDLAPEGCLQYFADSQGLIKSFNYDAMGSIVDNPEATYLNNLNYAICIKRAKYTCSVTYSNEPSGDFQLTNKDDDQIDIVPDGQAGVGIFNCPDDHIAINQVRLCGERFNDASDLNDYTTNARVRDVAAGPIILPFRTDSAYVGRGFQLLYQQDDCV